jgi:hypothetical protein
VEGANAIPEYLSYLLWLQRVEGERPQVRRPFLQRPGALETGDFAKLEALLDLWHTEMEEGVAPELLARELTPPCPASRRLTAERKQRTGLAGSSG